MKNKKLIIGIIAGLVVVVGVVIAIIFIMSNSTKLPQTMPDLKTAITNREAINCSITDKDNQTITLQSNDDWSKIFLGSDDYNMLIIKDDAIYTWMNGEGYKMTYNESMTEGYTDGLKDINGEDVDTSNYSVVCSNPKTVDFNLPSDIEFIDLSSFYQTMTNELDDEDLQQMMNDIE